MYDGETPNIFKSIESLNVSNRNTYNHYVIYDVLIDLFFYRISSIRYGKRMT